MLPGDALAAVGRAHPYGVRGRAESDCPNGQAVALGPSGGPGWERGVCPATYRRVCGVRQKSGWGEAGVWVEGIAKAEKRELSEAVSYRTQ